MNDSTHPQHHIPNQKRRRPCSPFSSKIRQLFHPKIILSYTLLLIVITHAQTQPPASVIFGTTDDTGDILLQRLQSNSNGDEKKAEKWVMYDFKPAFPPYSRGQMEELLMIHRPDGVAVDNDVAEEEDVDDDGSDDRLIKEDEADAIDTKIECEAGDGGAVDANENEDESNTNNSVADDQEDSIVSDTDNSVETDNVEDNTDAMNEGSHDEGEADTVTASNDNIDATDDATESNTESSVDTTVSSKEENDNDKLSVDENEEEEPKEDDGVVDENEESLDTAQVDDVDVPLSEEDDDTDATIEEDTKNEESPDEDNELTHDKEDDNHNKRDDLTPAVEPHNTAAPLVGPLPEPDTDDNLESSVEENETLEEPESSVEAEETMEKSDNSVEEEDTIGESESESESFINEEVIEVDGDKSLQEQSNEQDAIDGSVDESETANNDEESIVISDDDEIESEEDNEQNDAEDEEDQHEVKLEDVYATLNEEESLPEAPESSENESLTDAITKEEEEDEINIQYGDPLPPTFSPSPPSSNNKDANREFVTGLDDVDKLFESVEVPDELDVGADGSSMQDVLVGQALKIIGKKAKNLGDAIKVRFDKLAMPVKKALPQLGLFGDDDEDDETDIDAIFESLVNSNGKMEIPPSLEEEEEKSEFDLKLQQLKERVKDLPLIKSKEAQKVFKFTKEKWEQGKQLFDDLLNIFEGDDEDEDDDFDLSNMNLNDIQSLVR